MCLIYVNTEIHTLVNACRKGKDGAWEQLYNNYSPRLYGVCLRYARRPEDASDILQEGFVRIYKNIGQLKDPERLEPWMLRTMVNAAVNYVRRNVDFAVVSLDEEENEGMAVSLDTDGFQIDDVLKAIAELPPLQRLVFNLHEVDEEDYESIAQMLNIKTSSVRSLNCRAKLKLKEKLDSNER